MISDYEARLKAARGMREPRRARPCPGWSGLEGLTAGVWTGRYGRYFSAESCLVEWVFVWPDGTDETTTRAVLRSTEVEPDRPDALEHWRAFGLDARVSAGLSLAACRVEPAHAEMVFADSSGRREERFARRGMVPEWLGEPVADWLRGRLPPAWEVTARDDRAVRGHQAAFLAARGRAAGLRGLAARRARAEAAAWICPSDGRLYSVHCTASRSEGPPDPTALLDRLTCCPAAETPG